MPRRAVKPDLVYEIMIVHCIASTGDGYYYRLPGKPDHIITVYLSEYTPRRVTGLKKGRVHMLGRFDTLRDAKANLRGLEKMPIEEQLDCIRNARPELLTKCKEG